MRSRDPWCQAHGLRTGRSALLDKLSIRNMGVSPVFCSVNSPILLAGPLGISRFNYTAPARWIVESSTRVESSLLLTKWSPDCSRFVPTSGSFPFPFRPFSLGILCCWKIGSSLVGTTRADVSGPALTHFRFALRQRTYRSSCDVTFRKTPRTL